MRPSLRSTSTRTFVAWPAAVVALRGAGAVLGRRRGGWVLRGHGPARARLLAGAPLLAAGWATYRWCGRYRITRAGGPAGMSQGMPDRLVTDGPYAWSRNPMYSGHLVFLTGLAVASSSPAAAAVAVGHLPWFAARVRRDEERLRTRFPADYDQYAARVSRWGSVRVPGRPAHCRIRSGNGLTAILASGLWRGVHARRSRRGPVRRRTDEGRRIRATGQYVRGQ